MQRWKLWRIWVGLAALVVLGSPVNAQTKTQIRVRVVAHDAKIIGSGVGGARIVVKNAETGEVLAEGIQEGSTGDTKAIVVEPITRGASVFDTPGAAEFTVTIELDEPTVLEFVGEGPLGFAYAMQRATKRMLVVPGQDLLGDGVVLDLHGFIVELLEPTHIPDGAHEIQVRVRVRMMCGCTLEPAGLWDADRVAVRVQVYGPDGMVREAPLGYAGEPNIFTGSLSLDGVPEGSRVFVVVTDPARENFGMSLELQIN